MGDDNGNGTRRITLEEALKSKKATQIYMLMTMNEMHTTLKALPCKVHDERIGILEQCKTQIKAGWVVIAAIVGGLFGLTGIAISLYALLK